MLGTLELVRPLKTFVVPLRNAAYHVHWLLKTYISAEKKWISKEEYHPPGRQCSFLKSCFKLEKNTKKLPTAHTCHIPAITFLRHGKRHLEEISLWITQPSRWCIIDLTTSLSNLLLSN